MDGFELALSVEDAVRGGDLSIGLNLPPLPDASKEVYDISTSFSEPVILLEENASVIRGLTEAEKLSTKSEVAIVIATHGLPTDEDNNLFSPTLLSKENVLELIPSYRIEEFNLVNSVVILSACDTAAGFSAKADMFFTGLTQSFANTGSKLLVASFIQ